MKLKIEKDFTDKYDSKTHYKIGQEIDFEEKRAKELLADVRGLVSRVEEEKPEEEEKPKRRSNKKA